MNWSRFSNPRYTVVERHKSGIADWHAKVQVGDRLVLVGVERGRRLGQVFKHPYYEWRGYVREAGGKSIWNKRIRSDATVPDLLQWAQVL